jgi:hypothetical protein
MVFLWSRFRRAWTRVEGNPCTMIEEHIRNAFHTPAPRASSSGSHRIPRRFPPMPLETGRIWTTRPLFPAPDFQKKLFFSSRPGHFMCPSFLVSRASQQVHRRARCGETRRKLRTILSIINLKKSENVTLSRGVIVCDPATRKKINSESGSYYEKTFTKWAITNKVLWLLCQMG